MRAIASALLLALVACADDAPGEAPFATSDTIDCALSGAEAFARECGVERLEGEGAAVFVIHHPDGGFRRFRITDDGTGIAAADGADSARITPRDGEIEVALGADRYILPATIVDDAE